MLDQWQTAGFSDKQRAMLDFLNKVSQTPGEVREEDVELLRKTGIREEAILDGLVVCFAFDVINRIANAMDFEVWTAEDFASRARLEPRGSERYGFRA